LKNERDPLKYHKKYIQEWNIVGEALERTLVVPNRRKSLQLSMETGGSQQ
jgi:hypothetical protein